VDVAIYRLLQGAVFDDRAVKAMTMAYDAEPYPGLTGDGTLIQSYRLFALAAGSSGARAGRAWYPICWPVVSSSAWSWSTNAAGPSAAATAIREGRLSLTLH